MTVRRTVKQSKRVQREFMDRDWASQRDTQYEGRCHCVRLFATHRVAKNRLEFLILKGLNSMANFLIPARGNYIVFLIEKG